MYVPVSRYGLVAVTALRYLRYGYSVLRPIYKVVTCFFGCRQSKSFCFYRITRYVRIYGGVDIFDIVFDNFPYRGDRNVAVASRSYFRDIFAVLRPLDEGISRLARRSKRYRFVLYRVACRVRVDRRIHIVRARDIIYNIVYDRRINCLHRYMVRYERIIIPLGSVARFRGDLRFAHRYRFDVEWDFRHLFVVCHERSHVFYELPRRLDHSVSYTARSDTFYRSAFFVVPFDKGIAALSDIDKCYFVLDRICSSVRVYRSFQIFVRNGILYYFPYGDSFGIFRYLPYR